MDIKHLHHRIIASFSSVRKLFKVKAIYREPSAGPSARVHLESTTTEAFKILKGVRQGDPTKLFTAAMEDVFRNLDWQSNGIMIYGEYLTHLRFADDILLVCHDPLELQTMDQRAERREHEGRVKNEHEQLSEQDESNDVQQDTK